MNFLVTGGLGFIGSYVCKALLDKGHSVVAFDLLVETNVAETIFTPADMDRIEVVPGDITDPLQVMGAINRYNVDHVVHLASLLIPASNANPNSAVKINCGGLVNILEAARLLGIGRVVWASSVAVFGSPDEYPEEFIPNEAPHRPKSVYGACKSLCENLAFHYFDHFQVDSIGLRFTAVYGPGRIRGASAFATELIEKPALGMASKVPHGDDVIDWQYVKDIADMTVLATEVPTTGTRVFNTRSDIRSVREAADFVRQLFPGVRIQLQPGTFGIAWKLDDRGLKEEIGFEPKYSMEEGIRETAQAARVKAGLEPIS